MQIRMTRRALCFWPHAGADISTYFKRKAAWIERVEAAARVPKWDSARVTS